MRGTTTTARGPVSRRSKTRSRRPSGKRDSQKPWTSCRGPVIRGKARPDWVQRGAIRIRTSMWLKAQAAAAFVDETTPEFQQYLDWNSQCKTFDEHYCVAAQAL